MKLLFIEATRFTERIQQLRAESELWALEDLLCQDPERSNVIQGAGGFRKNSGVIITVAHFVEYGRAKKASPVCHFGTCTF